MPNPAMVNYGGRVVAASTPLRSLVRLDATPDTAIAERTDAST